LRLPSHALLHLHKSGLFFSLFFAVIETLTDRVPARDIRPPAPAPTQPCRLNADLFVLSDPALMIFAAIVRTCPSNCTVTLQIISWDNFFMPLSSGLERMLKPVTFL